MCIKSNRCDGPPRLILALIPYCASLCDVLYDCHQGLRSVGLFRTSWDCTTSCMLSKLGRVELSVRTLLGFSSLGVGRWGHKLQTEIMLLSHQLLCSNTIIVNALKLWFHRGDWWNREGTKVGLIQLHRSQYYSNATYRLKDECLRSACCLIDTHPSLHWVGLLVWDGCRVKQGNETCRCRDGETFNIFKNTAKKLCWQATQEQI